MSTKVKVLFLIYTFVSEINSKFIAVHDKFECCNPDGKPNRVDPRQMEVVPIDDGVSALNGTVRVLKVIKAPFHTKITSRKWERGQWVPAIVNKEVYDMCFSIKNPLEMWYPVTRTLKVNGCPVKPGVLKVVKM